ncbi:MAG: hypothetical protein Kow0079_17390 [Vicingaceae bacterium]
MYKTLLFFFILIIISCNDNKVNKTKKIDIKEKLPKNINNQKILNIKIENNKIYNIDTVLLKASLISLKEVYDCLEKDSCNKIKVNFNNTIIRFNYNNDSLYFANTKEQFVDDEQFLIGKYKYEESNIVYLFFISNEDLSDVLFVISIDSSGKVICIKNLFNKGGDGLIRYYPKYISTSKNKLTISEITEEYTSENLDTLLTTIVEKEIMFNKKGEIRIFKKLINKSLEKESSF